MAGVGNSPIALAFLSSAAKIGFGKTGYPGHVLAVIIRQKWSLDALTNSNGMVTCLNQEQLEVYPGQDPFLDRRALKSKSVREAAMRDT